MTTCISETTYRLPPAWIAFYRQLADEILKLERSNWQRQAGKAGTGKASDRVGGGDAVC